jgi:cbb3-type cytochrome oxidase subunit 3
MASIEGGCGKFLKFVFVFLNFLFLVLGLATFGFGCWGLIQGEKVFENDWFPKIHDEALQTGVEKNIIHAFTWLVVGAVILIGIAVLGFCGGCKENRCILGVFFVLVFIIFFIFVSALVLFFAFQDKVREGLDKAIEFTLNDEKKKYGNDTSVAKKVDLLQEKLECCLWNATVAEDLAVTSCFEKWPKDQAKKPADATFNVESCSGSIINKLKEWIERRKGEFSGFCVIILCTCLMQMILSCSLLCKIKNKQPYAEMK